MKCPLSPGVQVWTATALAVLAVDLFGETTLSDSFYAFSRTPGGFVVTTAGWAYLTAHMFGFIPSHRDPLVLAFSRVPKRRKVVITVV
jgi:hypothetical protein